MEVNSEGKAKMPKVAKVKNKMPAPVQITAEQLLREAKERELELAAPPPKQKISDPDELANYRLKKRKAFEDNIRKNRGLMTNWIKYAQWEESQKEIQRARSVWERSLDVDHRNITVWLKYAEMEMKNRQINHARNLWDRAVTILPRANQLWYKYTYMEEMLGNIAGTRQVFERWMEWEPHEQAWHSYINFELRCKELDRARSIYERFVITHPEIKNWIKYAKFEEKNGYINSSRKIYERAVEFFGEENMDEKLLIAFAKFEETQREHDRARVIYKYALDHLPKELCQEIYRFYTVHEKKFGSRAAIEDVIVNKRRFQYEEEVKSNPMNYDAWFDFLRLLEAEQDIEQIRDTYERAIANLPPTQEKRHWRRYIYLWINYALFEELEAEDMERTRQVYKACLDIIPHKKFTFAKIWLSFAQFEIRQKNLQQARKILGTAIGKCPKNKLFRGYIDLEIQLREFERCRILYEKFLEFNPENCTTWMKYTELETILGDIDRARAIYNLAINQPKLDMPEVLWKAFIDFEIGLEEYENTRALYRRLLERTQHVKVWVSFAQFERSTEEDNAIANARQVYREGHRSLRSLEDKEERLMLLEAWVEFEQEVGDLKCIQTVQKLMPQKVKKRRKIQTEDGTDAGWEEYYDYIFPDEEAAQPNLKLLAMAKKWKEKQEQSSDEEEDEEDDDEDDKAGQSSQEQPSSSQDALQAKTTEDATGGSSKGSSESDDSQEAESTSEDTSNRVSAFKEEDERVDVSIVSKTGDPEGKDTQDRGKDGSGVTKVDQEKVKEIEVGSRRDSRKYPKQTTDSEDEDSEKEDDEDRRRRGKRGEQDTRDRRSGESRHREENSKRQKRRRRKSSSSSSSSSGSSSDSSSSSSSSGEDSDRERS
ncbi:crooked neck-like protein 1 [Liolophura sinensis]|uniref:crooked neck-like protein 1 n=1 Tax=Liolophura sinensis TaxID=3198878 RepID=UPI003158059C